jgi:hypothetical protein
VEIITLLVVETNRYYHQFLDNSDGPSPHCEVTEAEMFVFLALTLQMGHQFKAECRTTGQKWIIQKNEGTC